MLNAFIATSLALELALAVTAPAREPSAPRLKITPAGRLDLGEAGPLETRTQCYTFANRSARPISLRRERGEVLRDHANLGE